MAQLVEHHGLQNPNEMIMQLLSHLLYTTSTTLIPSDPLPPMEQDFYRHQVRPDQYHALSLPPSATYALSCSWAVTRTEQWSLLSYPRSMRSCRLLYPPSLVRTPLRYGSELLIWPSNRIQFWEMLVLRCLIMVR